MQEVLLEREPASPPSYRENLVLSAAESFRLSQGLCRDCEHFHALWPYLRMARSSPSVDAGIEALQARLAGLLSGGGRRIAIAGAGDAGLLALVARAAAGSAENILVIDRCATPLELCRAFAGRWSLPLQTLKHDLTALALEEDADVVLAHSVLSFIPREKRLDLLRRLNRSLSPDGHLLIKFNTGRPKAASSEYDYAEATAAALEGRGVTLPEARPAFLARLREFGLAQSERELAFETANSVQALLDAAGFRMEELTPIEKDRAAAFGYHAEVARESFFAVARPVR